MSCTRIGGSGPIVEIIRPSSEDANGSDFKNNMKMQMDMCRSEYSRVI
jgi:hypothetical protein